MLFRLKPKCGNHIGPPDKDGNRITYKAGDRITSDVDLVAKWGRKFELISASDDGAPIPTAPEIPVPVLDGKKEETPKSQSAKIEIPKVPVPEVSKYGIDVTKDFPTAAKAEIKVFEKSKWFTVVDTDDDEVLNEKKLRKSKVEAFLVDYLPDAKGEDEDTDTDTDDDDDDNDDDDEDDDEE